MDQHPSAAAPLSDVPTYFRASVPALARVIGGRPAIYLDSPSGAQMPEPVLRALTDYIRNGMANRHGEFLTSEETEAAIHQARRAVADLIGGRHAHVVFGQNMTSLAFALATALARDWSVAGRRGRVVVSAIDHHANVDPWVTVARDHGFEVAWLPVDPNTVNLDLTQLDRLVRPETTLVAVSMAANAVGSVQDVSTIARRAHEVGAITIVDAVHAVPHLPVNMQALGADVLFCSAYKFFGPHIGVMAVEPELLDRVRIFKVAPAPNSGPEKAETGSQNHEAIAGLAATIAYLEKLGRGRTRAARLHDSMLQIKRYEDHVVGQLLEGLAAIPGIRVYRAPDPNPKTPTVAFTVEGRAPAAIARFCGDRGLLLTHGDFYACNLAETLGVATRGGWVRAGMAPYITSEEVDDALAIIGAAARA